VDAPRLTIELVPATGWFDNVRSRVSKEQWDALRRPVFKAAGYRCEICGGRGEQWPVECHERWSYDDIALIQRLEGLIALCPSCHEVKHFGLAMKRGRFAFAQAHLEKVNGWDRRTSNIYIMRVFDQWEARSRHEWHLDLSWLALRGVVIPTQGVVIQI
jgi:hypothetical protein